MVTNNNINGILLALFAAVCFALSNTLASLAYTGGLTPITMSATRFILPAIILFLILLIRREPILLPSKLGLACICLGVITSIYTLALLSAIERLPVPIAILVFYLFPILTGVFLALFGWEKLTRARIISAFVAFFGLALALGVSFEKLDGEGLAYAATAAIGMALVSAISNYLIKGEDPRQATMYMAATAVIVMIILVIGWLEFQMPKDETGWVGFCLSNILYAIAMILFFYAISAIGAGSTTFYVNIEPLVVTFAAFVFLDQVLVPLQFIGIVVVVGALMYQARSD
ncbi:MAG: DMT family transporter [Pseudomonadota bacterium]|nr:DMT family transporter [Pseudomonadota bacterium]